MSQVSVDVGGTTFTTTAQTLSGSHILSSLVPTAETPPFL